MVSRLPTISLKTARVPPRLVAPALVLVGLGFALLIAAPFLLMSAIAVGYLLLLPFTIYRYEWLAAPRGVGDPVRERRAVARAARSARRLGLRSPLRRRVAGGRAEGGRARSSGRDRAAARPPRPRPPTNGASPRAATGRGRRLGLRRR